MPPLCAGEGKGKLERWHRTFRNQFLSELDRSRIHDLNDLNTRLWAWLEQVYHRRMHTSLKGLTPLERYQQDLARIRTLGSKAHIEKVAEDKQMLPVWIIDEAQNLPPEFFRDFPALLNFAFDSRNLMTVWLAGHPMLAHTLDRAPYAALSSRIHARCTATAGHGG